MHRKLGLVLLLIGAFLTACTTRQPLPPPTEPQPDLTPVVFHAFQMVNESVGWAAGEGLIRTADGGRTWTHVLPLSQRNAWTALDADRAWAASQSSDEKHILVHRTTTGGKDRETAQIPLPDSLVGASPVSSSFADATHGWLMVEPMRTSHSHPGYLFATADGGKNWSLVASTADTLPVGGAIRLEPGRPEEGWLSGNQVSTVPADLYRTTDGGRTWEKQKLELPPNRLEPGQIDYGLPMFGPDGTSGLLAATWVPESGHVAAYATLLFRTTDGGATWQHLRSYLPLAVIGAHDATKLWAWQGTPRDTGSTVPVTGSWEIQAAPWTTGKTVEPDPTLRAALENGWNIAALQFVSDNAGWALLEKPGEAPHLLQTKDGAQSWTQLKPAQQK